MGFRANLNKKFKVALNPSSKVASYPANQKSKKKKEMGGGEVIKDYFSRSYQCYGNLLWHHNYNNVLTND